MGKLRAVIYNRCSTEEESQKDALLKQVQESKDCVREQGWELADVYVEAKSGTTRKGRKEYNRLYRDLEGDKFDVIVIKSQDRLMRNTKDWYLFLERMQKNRKRLYMYLEHKFYTPDDALVTGIKAILAEEYSRELSKKINNAHRNRQKEGRNFVLTNQAYGFRKLPDKSVAVDEREAEMIRMIFRLSASGYGTHCSAEILYQNGYRNRNGKMLGPSGIRNIIRNPIYKGTVIQNRKHYDFESRQVFKNPQSEWIIHENAVPAIVDGDLFEKANQGLDRRRQEGNRGATYRKGSSPGKYSLSGKLFCGLCGSPFYRTVSRKKDGQEIKWKCCNYLHNGRKDPRRRREQRRKAVKREDAGYGLGNSGENNAGCDSKIYTEYDRKNDMEHAVGNNVDCDMEYGVGYGIGCDNVHLDEKKLYGVLGQFARERCHGLEMQRAGRVKKMLAVLGKALRNGHMAVRKGELETTLEKVTGQKERLLEKLLENVISDEEFKAKNQDLQNRIEYMQGQLKELEGDVLPNAALERRIESIRVKLEGGVVEEAEIADMVGGIRKIEVFPDCLEIFFDSLPDSLALVGVAGEGISSAAGSGAGKLTAVRIPQACAASHRAVIEEEKKAVLELMGRKPKITAREIAGEMGVNLSLVHRRIRELKAEGKIRYSSPNGRGEWLT